MCDEEESLFQFPCEFPIKIVGDAGDDFEAAIMAIFNRHVADLGEGAVRLKPSRNGNYTSMTVTIMAQSRAQLDAIYLELTSCEHVKFAL